MGRDEERMGLSARMLWIRMFLWGRVSTLEVMDSVGLGSWRATASGDVIRADEERGKNFRALLTKLKFLICSRAAPWSRWEFSLGLRGLTWCVWSSSSKIWSYSCSRFTKT